MQDHKGAMTASNRSRLSWSPDSTTDDSGRALVILQPLPPDQPMQPFPVKSRQRIRVLAAAALLVSAWVAQDASALVFDDVAMVAAQLAAAPYRKPAESLPKELAGVTYDQYRDIRNKPENFYWRDTGSPFELGFFHRGLYYNHPVRINEVTARGPVEIKYDPRLFDFGNNKFDPARLAGLGFAGFRVHYPINNAKVKDEVVVFLGASYFRALGKDQGYGLSARGLALDTGLPSGEEFPRFVEFWIERPTATAKELVIYGLLDSRRAAGAYRFVIRPGATTTVEVRARLFLREAVGKIGVAPLTSMFAFGENQRSGTEDYRPEVHDSDGLLVHTANDEWIWRPLVNPKRLLVTSFAAANPRGFGLMQRDRDFSRYEDLEARYERRPSAWVKPAGSWGPGRVELVQIPSPDETNDNIVAYWVPDTPPVPGQPWDVGYSVLWQKDQDARPPNAWVLQTRRGHGYVRRQSGSLGLVIDFDGPALRKLPADAKVELVVSGDANVEILRRNAHRNEATGGWRAALELKRVDKGKPAELRAFLRHDGNTLSETWSYILPIE